MTGKKMKRQKVQSRDEIREDIGESLERRGIHDRSLLTELLETFGVHLGREKYRIERDMVKKEKREEE